MKNLIKYMLIVSVFAGITSCDDFLEPTDENRLDADFINTDPASAEGLLLQGYSRLINQFSFSESATDDAVNNQLTNGYKRMALGELNAQYNPASRWNNYESVLWVNKFLEVLDAGKIVWSKNEQINKMFYMRMRGEALALRALHHFYVLQAHAGVSTSGQLLGVPYITDYIESDGNFNRPRLSFEATVEAIMADFDAALDLLPTDYSDDSDSIDAVYKDYDSDNYIVVNGSGYNLRISGRIVKALKARVALFAASPSFLNGQGQKDYYKIAAENAASVLKTIGGFSGVATGAIDYYKSYSQTNDDEMIWRGSAQSPSSSVERNLFPPSLNGRGNINPTQNFVDAFPMASGYPATTANGYDAQNPYANRDPRLAEFVIYNGSSFGGKTINTGVGGAIDRVDSIAQFSTTTGYYLKKLLRPDVKINDNNTSNDKIHYNVYFRYTELFLIFAEAANEAGTLDQDFYDMTARKVIGAIRARAGIAQPDDYLKSINSKEAMRELIRNERRIELSFEGHRFWDLRRWGASLNETVKGSFFDGTDYVELPAVEQRNYQPFATYMPIPNAEVLKFSELEQNNGW